MARISPVFGRSATTEPVKPLPSSWLYAVCWTSGSMVSTTLPPLGSRPVIRSESRRPNSRSSLPLSTPSVARSIPPEEKYEE